MRAFDGGQQLRANSQREWNALSTTTDHYDNDTTTDDYNDNNRVTPATNRIGAVPRCSSEHRHEGSHFLPWVQVWVQLVAGGESRKQRRERKIREAQEKHVDILTIKLGQVLADAYDRLDPTIQARFAANPGVSVRREGRYVIASCNGEDFAWIEHAWLVDDTQTEVDAMTFDTTMPETVPEEWQ